MVTQEIECEITILELPEHKSIFSTGFIFEIFLRLFMCLTHAHCY
jgi:hypothetical protein